MPLQNNIIMCRSTPESSPAVVSMRDLIAEAEAEDKQAKKNALKSTTKVTTVSGKAVEEKYAGPVEVCTQLSCCFGLCTG